MTFFSGQSYDFQAPCERMDISWLWKILKDVCRTLPPPRRDMKETSFEISLMTKEVRPSATPPRVVLDPACYQHQLLRDLRYGFDPAPNGPVAPCRRPNGPSCFNEWSAMCEYMSKMDDLGCLSDGVWTLPPDAVLSAMHCVVRPGDLRAHRRNPAVPYPVRVVTDLTDSTTSAHDAEICPHRVTM